MRRGPASTRSVVPPPVGRMARLGRRFLARQLEIAAVLARFDRRVGVLSEILVDSVNIGARRRLRRLRHISSPSVHQPPPMLRVPGNREAWKFFSKLAEPSPY